MFIPNQEARKSLSKKLNLPFSEIMQDWEWEIADSKRITEFIQEYYNPETTLKEKESLIEIIIQCAEDLLEDNMFDEFEKYIDKINLILKQNKELHSDTIKYWTISDFLISEKLIKD